VYDSTHNLAINKLIILLLIKKTGLPLSNSQIADFITLNNYSEYFSVQQYIAELCASDFLEKSEEHHVTYYMITKEGLKILDMFSSQIPQYIKEVIILYTEKNNKQIKHQRDIKAEYIPNKSNEFIVKCSIEENKSSLINISINVASKEQAKLVCENWKNNASYLYGSIFTTLVNKNPQ
jgi:predicted transcriptional regulator